MTAKPWMSSLALMLVLGVVVAPAIAQKAKDVQAKDDRMNSMQGRMDHMMGVMGEMSGMMRQHHTDMQKGCPGMRSPDQPKQGG